MCQLNDYQKEVNESEVESSFIPSFVSQCLDASSKAPEYVLSADDDSVNYSVVQDAIMDKKSWVTSTEEFLFNKPENSKR